MVDRLIYEEAGFNPIQFQHVYSSHRMYTALGLICGKLRNEPHMIFALFPGASSK